MSRSSSVALDAGRRVERPPTDQFPALQILDQRGVEPGDQLRRRVESLPDQTGLRLADQRPHLRVPGVVARILHEDQAVRPDDGGVIELPLRRRHAFVVLGSVVAAEQPDVQVASFDFVEVEIVRPSIGRGSVLEQESVEEPTHQHVVANVVAQCRPLRGELALHAADEDAEGRHDVRCPGTTPSGVDFIRSRSSIPRKP